MPATNSSPPITLAEFGTLLKQTGAFQEHPHIAVALSGGSDSMALTLLAYDWIKSCGGMLTALTVDHGLRAESAEEAKQVKVWCEALGIAHHVLTAQNFRLETQGKIQEIARERRYKLLTDYCKHHNIQNLLTAHQREDQAETLFFRLARGSGLMGLACIAPVSMIHGIQLVRPLLSIPKARLVATLAQRHHPWIEDPTNQKPIYTRNRIRALIAASTNTDDICERAYRVSEVFGKFRRLLEKSTAEKLASCVSYQPDGTTTIDPAAFLALEPEYGRGVITKIVGKISKGEHTPRTEKLERFYAGLYQDIEANISIKRTFSRCLFQFQAKNNIIVVSKEIESPLKRPSILSK